MPLWIFSTVVSGFCGIVSNVANRSSLSRWGDGTAFGWWFEVGRTLFAFLAIIFLGLGFFTPVSGDMLKLFGLGIFELISVYYFMKMHALAELSISSVVIQLRLIWVPLIAFFFLGETLPTSSYFGILLIFIGAIFVASPKHWRLDKGVIIALIASIATAVLSVFAKVVSPLASSSVIMFWWSLPSVLIIPLLLPHAKNRLPAAWVHSHWGIIASALSNIIGMYLLIYALKLGPVSIVMPIYYGLNLLSAFFGITVLKERSRLIPKIIGAAIAFIGIIFVF